MTEDKKTTSMIEPVIPDDPKGKGLGIAGMVLGIIAAANSFVPISNLASFPIAILGFILGLIGFIQARKTGGSSGFGLAGFILSGAALVIIIVVTIMTLVIAVPAAQSLMTYYNTTS